MNKETFHKLQVPGETTFHPHTTGKETYIIEGWPKDGNVFSIKRFICRVQEQETPEKTAELGQSIAFCLNFASKIKPII